MQSHAMSPILICMLVATQVVGPATLWAVEERSIRNDESRRVVIVAIDGTQLTVRNEDGSRPLQFRDVVHVYEQLATGDHTVADLLIGNRAVVTMGYDTALQLLAVNPEQTTIQVTKGLVRVVAAASALGPHGVVTVQTPTGQVQTYGGIVRVRVETPVEKTEAVPKGEAKAYRTAYASEQVVAASPQSESIQVEEGIAEILEDEGNPTTIQPGQSVTLDAGKAGVIGEKVTYEHMRPKAVATPDHSQTPKEGREYLVALPVNQATELGKVIAGASETAGDDSDKESDKKSDTKNVINGATGGVTIQNNLVSALFGTGGAANPATSNPTNTTGTGYGGHNRNGPFVTSAATGNVGLNDSHSLLVFTRKDPIQPVVNTTETLDRYTTQTGIIVRVPDVQTEFRKGTLCEVDCLASHYQAGKMGNVNFIFDKKVLPSVKSNFLVAKELILTGGASNEGHGGIAPKERLLIRGAANSQVEGFTNLASTTNSGAQADGLYPTNRLPADIGDLQPIPGDIVKANSTFVVETPSKLGNHPSQVSQSLVGGTLGQYSSEPLLTEDNLGLVVKDAQANGFGNRVDGAITATGANAVLKGGVTLDQGTTATIGTTTATDTYFKDLTTDLGRTFSGSLLSVINGPNSTPTVLTMQNRMLGAYDGSTVSGGDPTCNEQACNKALLSVLDAKLKGSSGSIQLIDIAAGKHFDRDENQAPGSQLKVTVTTALVTRSTIPLDSALLEASAPLFALTQAEMTTTNHFADLAGSHAQSLKLGDALVALDASKLVINSGHLLNLNNATAAIGGYLFSLANGSQLDIKNGALFSPNNGSSLTLNGNAFGVFGSGRNTLSIDNNLCTGACGSIVNSANQPIMLPNGTPLKVAGVTQNVVLPNNFNVFAGNAAGAQVNIGPDDALFHVDDTSALTIRQTTVVKP